MLPAPCLQPPAAPLWRRLWIAVFAACWWLALSAGAQAATAVVLDAATPSVIAWPAVSLLPEAPGSAALTLEQARAAHARGAFSAPVDRPYANLGPETRAMWLHIPLRLAADAPAHWIASLDYPSLDRVELWVLDAGGQVVHHDVLGDTLPAHERSLRARALATAVHLTPGQDAQMILRVNMTGAMILPLTFWQPDAFHAEESTQMLHQGLLIGVALCLFIYAFLYWVSTREPMYLYYAATVAANSAFFLAFHGVGALHLWGAHAWITANIAPAATLITVAGSAKFIDHVLGETAGRAGTRNALQVLSLVCLLCFGLFLTGSIDYRMAQTLATITGCLPMVLGLPVSITRARGGDRAARYLVLGWMFYAVCIFMTAGLLRGWLDASDGFMHALQYGATLEIMTWLLVLALRTQKTREAAELARQERDVMHSLAHTDVLTGLRNRRGLMHTLGERLGGLDREVPLALFMLDLDGFKPVNDRLGHDAGDTLLKQVALRLSAAVRAGDVVARLGGDEFVVLAPGLRQADDALAVGGKLQAAFQEHFALGEQTFKVGATIGCALAPVHGTDADTLLREADAAMYRGKEAGKSRLVMAALPERSPAPQAREAAPPSAAAQEAGWSPAI